MDPIKAIIADDEKPLRTYLKALLSDVWKDLFVCGEAANGPEALSLIEKHRPEIAFLDIRMPGLSGMEVAAKIKGGCRIVFVTAYDQYAVKAFEHEAIDYLLKPVTRERLKMTVRRLQEHIPAPSAPPARLAETIERLISDLSDRQTPGYLQWIRTRHGDSMRLIPVDDICYFKATDKYTAVMTQEGESLIRKPIRDLVQELDPESFWQIHRGTIVNASCVDKIGRSFGGKLILKLKNRSETLTVSRTYARLFKQM